MSSITLKRDENSVTLNVNLNAAGSVRKMSAVFAAKSAPSQVISDGRNVDFEWDENRQEIKISVIYPGKTKIIF